ncbi:hypothetical protein [Flavihumibacter petaseus]|nr:hypothetical protein [Flavihumibacter petaseus]
MKTANTSIKRIAAFGALVLALVFTAGTANANGEKVKDANRIPVDVRYVGSINQQPVLEVAYDNPAGEAMNITLRDLDGNVLYTGSFTDKKIAKRFQFDNQGSDDIKIKLTVSQGKKSQTEIFQINRNSQVIEQVVVAKL